MNLLRAYPASVPLSAYGSEGLHPFEQAGTQDQWDVDRFNSAYFDGLRQRLEALESHGILVHLQLWQIVFFKPGEKRWDINYLNPENNVNTWTDSFHSGKDYIDAPTGSVARDHQRAWVRRVLDAAKGRGNVWIDVINELGNGMGTLEWAVEVTGWIREWEKESGQQFLVGVDSEHHYRPEIFSPYADHFDLIMLNELQEPARARRIFDSFRKPIVSVRSSDGRNLPEDYLFANPEQTTPAHETRYRTLCYRSIFSNLQSVGAYWKMEVATHDYQSLPHWPKYAEALHAFWNEIAPEWPSLQVDDSLILSSPVTSHAYGMRSEKLQLVYLECGPRGWDNTYPPSTLELASSEGEVSVTLFHPQTGNKEPTNFEQTAATIKIALPEFRDDLIIIARAH